MSTGGALLQLHYSQDYCSILSNNYYSKAHEECPMIMTSNNISTKLNYVYKLDLGRKSDEFFVLGMTFYLNNKINNNELIKQILNNHLIFFTYRCEFNCEPAKTDDMYHIGSIPLYLAEIKYFESKIFLKFPSKFFSQYDYFNGFVYWGCYIKSEILFDKITINQIFKFLESDKRREIASYFEFYSHNPIQFVVNTNTNTNENNDKLTYLTYKYDSKYIDKIRGFFINIPDELIYLIKCIKFKFKNYSNIILNLEEIKIIKETENSKIYWIGINSLDLNPFAHTNILSPTYYSSPDPDDCIDIMIDIMIDNSPQYQADNNKYINDIRVDLLCSNVLVGTDLNLKLKYSNEKLNLELEPKELEFINKFSNSNSESDLEIRIVNTLKIAHDHLKIKKYIKKNNLSEYIINTQPIEQIYYSSQINSIKEMIDRI